MIPTFQRRDVVCAAVEALGRTGYDGPVEAIVVIDGSTDDTEQALSKLELPFSLRVIRQANLGAAAARNRGAAESCHDILLFLDDDMLCAPDMISEHARFHLAGAEAVVGDARREAGSPPGFMSDSNEAWLKRKGGPLTLFEIWTGQLSVRRAVFEKLGGFDETFTNSSAFANEDADLGIRLLAGYNVQYNPAAISFQRYVVTPRELIRRAPLRASGDVLLARKHPQVTRDLFEARGISRWSTRYVFGPLSAIPLLARLWAALATPVADVGLKTPLRSSKTLSRFFLGARAAVYWAELRRLGWYPLSNRLLVLGYHAVQDWANVPVLRRYAVPREVFVGHLDSLARRGFTFVTPKMAASYITEDSPLPRRAVLLTFDDCYLDLLEIARDLLKARGIGGIAFAVTGLKSAFNVWDESSGQPARRLLSTHQLKQLPALGIDLGSHSRSHLSLVAMNDVQLKNETQGSAEDIEALGVRRPDFFAYPFGELDDAARNAVRQSGYLAAMGISEGWVERDSDRFNLPRVILHGSDRGWRFRLRTAMPALFERLDMAQARLRVKQKGTAAS